MSEDTTFHKAGQIQVREGKKGIEFYAFNFQHKKSLHIGTLIGATYEKTAPILQKPEPSFCSPQAELAAIEQAGGQFIRFIGRGRPGTFAISLEDFKLHGEPYLNPGYGPQIRVSLRHFAYSVKVGRRNAIIDNPPVMRNDPLEPVTIKQMSLFGG
jgi:hypothetical protein